MLKRIYLIYTESEHRQAQALCQRKQSVTLTERSRCLAAFKPILEGFIKIVGFNMI